MHHHSRQYQPIFRPTSHKRVRPAHILLPQYLRNYYTYSSLVKVTYVHAVKISPRALVRGIPTRTEFVHKNWRLCLITNGSLARYLKLRVAHGPGMSGTFSTPPRYKDPDTHYGTCITHMPWCMPGSVTSGFLWSQWRGKCSRHSWRMRNPQFRVFGKRPIDSPNATWPGLCCCVTHLPALIWSSTSTVPILR